MLFAGQNSESKLIDCWRDRIFWRAVSTCVLMKLIPSDPIISLLGIYPTKQILTGIYEHGCYFALYLKQQNTGKA